MSDITELGKRLKTRTERELEAMGEGMKATTSKPNQAPRVKAGERAGVGSNNTSANKRALGAQLRAKIKAAEAAGNVAMATKFRKQLAAILTAK